MGKSSLLTSAVRRGLKAATIRRSIARNKSYVRSSLLDWPAQFSNLSLTKMKYGIHIKKVAKYATASTKNSQRLGKNFQHFRIRINCRYVKTHEISRRTKIIIIF